VRIPKFFGYFEHAIAANSKTSELHAVGSSSSYVDLSLFQVMVGFAYAFPRAHAHLAPKFPHLVALRDRVAARPRIKTYLASERRLPFNEKGIFRHYPELDQDLA
jgi:glutathione S-transferase